MKKLLPLTLIFIFSACLLTSCKKDKGDPPVLPPQESMTIDFSNFASAKKSADLISEQKGENTDAWKSAATVAGMWNLIITTTLAVPVASFKLAFNQTPAYLDTKTWQWSYNVSVGSLTYKARLTGQIRTSDVQWKMYIKEESGATEYLWFEGTSKLDGKSGQWILNQSSKSPVAMLQIDWTKPVTTIGSIKYTYVKNDSFKNSYIEYGLTTGTLNAYYTIHYFNGLQFSDVNVEWNTSTKNGRVKSVDYPGDSNWYCWDANKITIICQ